MDDKNKKTIIVLKGIGLFLIVLSLFLYGVIIETDTDGESKKIGSRETKCVKDYYHGLNEEGDWVLKEYQLCH
jgi:hypothetical protein